MRFRTPLLETFSFQPPILAFQATPPVAPTAGDRYVVLAPGTGAWATHATQIAWYYTGSWQFDTPAIGWLLNNTADNTLYRFNGTAWEPLPASIYWFDIEGGHPDSVYGGVFPVEGGSVGSIFGGTSGVDGGSP